ncbi:hypothetical protein SLA2020_123850 [Shorea laevis]
MFVLLLRLWVELEKENNRRSSCTSVEEFEEIQGILPRMKQNCISLSDAKWKLLLDVPLDSSAWDTFLYSLPDLEMLTGNLAGSSNVASTGGDKSHHDPLGMQGETTAAAGSSGGCATQS